MSRPWMPLYVADYLRDTRKLTAAEHGAYLLLIMEYWTAGALPDDDRQLARIASMSAAEWRRARPNIEGFFHDDWRHKRLDAELARSAEISSKRAASAKQRYSNCSANAQQEDTHARASSQPQLQQQSSLRSDSARKRGARLPEAWGPSGEDWKAAFVKLTIAGADEELKKFKDYWKSQPGQRGVKLDWDATWRNWIRNAKGQPNGNGTHTATRRSPSADFFAGMRSVAQDIDGDGSTPGPASEEVPLGRVNIEH